METDKIILKLLLALILPEVVEPDTVWVNDLGEIWVLIDRDKSETPEVYGTVEDALKTLREIGREHQDKQFVKTHLSKTTITGSFDYKEAEERISKELIRKVIRKDWEVRQNYAGEIEWVCPGENCGGYICHSKLDAQFHYCSYCETDWDLEDLIHVE